MTEPQIIIFDGVCGLCNRFVDFVLRRDRQGRFRFAALQSEAGAELRQHHGLDGVDTVVLVREGRSYQRSAAALRVLGQLRWPWPLFMVFLVVPPVLRDIGYDWIARNRYRWFGKRESCRVPTAQERQRFLDC